VNYFSFKDPKPKFLSFILFLFFLKKMIEERVMAFRYREERMRARVGFGLLFIESKISSGRWI